MTGWAPILYARSRSEDVWWRALPADRATDPWLTAAVAAVVAGGRDLDHGPRFLYGWDGRARLFGVACLCTEISDTMTAVEGRPAYCFVGWLSQDAPPSWESLSSSWRQWSADVYEQWLAPDWERPAELPHHTPYGPPPSPSPLPSPPGHQRETADPGLRRTGTEVWPIRDGGQLWARLAADPQPSLAVLGLRTVSPRRLAGLTHATAVTAAHRSLVPQRGEPPAPDTPSPAPPGLLARVKSRLGRHH